MKSSTDTLQDKFGGGLDRFLFAPLRDHADEPAIQRVDEVLSLLVSAEAYRREKIEYIDRCSAKRIKRGIPEFLDLLERSKESERAYYQTLELLNIKLSRYRWEATLSGDIDGFRSEIIPAHSKSKWEYSGRGARWDATELWKYSEYTESFVAQRDQLLTQVGETQPSKKPQSSWESMESFMVASLLEALNSGEISRYRRCSECHQWFYAVRGHQHFCGDSCRRKHEAQSPAFKQKRATYMRETYRPNEKRKDALAKRQAARELSQKSKKGGK
jgi:hypothetical protein